MQTIFKMFTYETAYSYVLFLIVSHAGLEKTHGFSCFFFFGWVFGCQPWSHAANNLRDNFFNFLRRAEGLHLGCENTKACVSPNDEYCAVGSSDGSLYVWKMSNGVLQATLSGEHR